MQTALNLQILKKINNFIVIAVQTLAFTLSALALEMAGSLVDGYLGNQVLLVIIEQFIKKMLKNI